MEVSVKQLRKATEAYVQKTDLDEEIIQEITFEFMDNNPENELCMKITDTVPQSYIDEFKELATFLEFQFNIEFDNGLADTCLVING